MQLLSILFLFLSPTYGYTLSNIVQRGQRKLANFNQIFDERKPRRNFHQSFNSLELVQEFRRTYSKFYKNKNLRKQKSRYLWKNKYISLRTALFFLSAVLNTKLLIIWLSQFFKLFQNLTKLGQFREPFFRSQYFCLIFTARCPSWIRAQIPAE